ncbi:hypothetical protein [Marinicellulosiphila megalodicopiae]|uniref:hypothetical protein n=1 Tax=Marinicellulosiphila megalodicopiae TaxID=2724896 RepID=UPI003BAEA646
MMTNIDIRNNQLPEIENLSKLNTKQLKDLFAVSLEYTAKHLTYLAAIWLELENRNIDLSALKKGIAVYIPMIAHNRIDPKLVIGYAGQKTLLNALSMLNIEEQNKIASTGSVRYIDPATGIEKKVDLVDLSAKMIPQIFADNKIRTIKEQKNIIEESLKNTKPKGLKIKKTSTVTKLKLDGDYLVISDKRIKLDHILNFLTENGILEDSL